MCDDLIERHFINSSASYIVHPSPPGITHFTLNPTGRVWVITHTPTVDTAVIDDLRPKWTTLNTYDPASAEWAKDWNHSVERLREMKLNLANVETRPSTPTHSSPPASPTTVPTTPETSPLTGGLPENYRPSNTLTTKAWYLKTYPALANTVHKAGAQVFSVADHSKSIPKRAGWITFIPDKATGRVYISSLEVLEAHRRRGLAKWLVGAVIEWWAKATKGQGTVWLTVFETNEAAGKLYEGLGFQKTRDLWVITRAGTKRRLSVKTDEWGCG